MAKAPKVDTAHLKALLSKSKDEPVNCAIGFAEDGLPVIMLHKSKQPRAILKMIEDEHGQVKNGRFGTAFVDMEEDAKLVILQLNKPVSGAAAKLKKALKGTGFAKVRIMLEDGTLAEADEVEEEAEGAVGVAQGAHFDAGALRGHLAELVKGLPAHIALHPEGAQELKALALEAQAKLKANEPAAEALVHKLAAGLKHGSAAHHPVDKVKIGKSKLVWSAALKKVHGEVAAAKSEIVKAVDGTELGAEVEAAFNTKVAPSLGKLDHALHDALERLEKAEGAAAHGEAVAHAHKVIGAFQKHLSTDPAIAHFDKNPFAPVAIGKTLSATLTALSTAIA